MAGHSKWKQIKHKKAKTDAQKGKVFSKIGREIMIATRLGGDDLASNFRLRLAVQKAKEANMPNDNIKRAIQKGVGPADGSQFEEVTFEAYAPNGVALLIESLTDNRNRTVPNIKSVLGKYGGNLATPGAVSFLFDTVGLITVAPGASEEAVMDVVLAAGAEDLESFPDGSIEVRTAVSDFEAVKAALESAEFVAENAEITKLPKTPVSLTAAQAQTLTKLMDTLEEDDDVQNVYASAEMPDDLEQD
jgi:YebC/PmpR family DNA-binding regulatory protein